MNWIDAEIKEWHDRFHQQKEWLNGNWMVSKQYSLDRDRVYLLVIGTLVPHTQRWNIWSQDHSQHDLALFDQAILDTKELHRAFNKRVDEVFGERARRTGKALHVNEFSIRAAIGLSPSPKTFARSLSPDIRVDGRIFRKINEDAETVAHQAVFHIERMHFRHMNERLRHLLR